VARTCFKSIAKTELAAIETAGRILIELNVIVAVTADALLFETIMLVTTVVVAAGTVYRVVLEVAAAVLASTLLVVAINYYLLIYHYSTF
jgi:hypothetical protein